MKKMILLTLVVSSSAFAGPINDNTCTEYYSGQANGDYLGQQSAAGFFTTVASTGWLSPVGGVLTTAASFWQLHINTIAPILVEAEAGRGPNLYSLLSDVQKKLKNPNITIDQLATAVNTLNQRKAFCAEKRATGENFVTAGEFLDLVVAEVRYETQNH